MERMTCGNGGIGLGIALGLAEADSVQNLIERRLIYCTGKLRNPPESVGKFGNGSARPLFTDRWSSASGCQPPYGCQPVDELKGEQFMARPHERGR
jgi:hypothetical protein